MTTVMIIAAAIVGVLPALLVYFVGKSLTGNATESSHQGRWTLFWLVTVCLLMLPYAIFAPIFLTSAAGLALALLAPTLWSAQALLILDLASLRQLLREHGGGVDLISSHDIYSFSRNQDESYAHHS